MYREKIHYGNLDIDAYFNVYNRKLIGMPIEVKGDFNANRIGLTSLENIPRRIEGNLNLMNNDLSNLSNFPEYVKGDILLNNNKLTSLKHLPKIVKGKLDVSGNSLKSLKHCSTHIYTNFKANHNLLENLLHGPEFVGNEYSVAYNKIKTLKFLPEQFQIINFLCNNLSSLYLIRYFNCKIKVSLEIEQEFLKFFEKDYYPELYEFIIKNKYNVDSIKWPKGFLKSNYVKSSSKVNKFNL